MFPDGRILTAKGVMEGVIGREAAGDGGFGYDPIFYLPETGQSVAQMPLDEKNEISHRGKALRLHEGKAPRCREGAGNMKVLVLSDSHGSFANMEAALKKLSERISAVIHLGDFDYDAERIRQLCPGLPGLCRAGGTTNTEAKGPWS